ncbi:class I adenylate-forming enzyme family protein [Nocardia nova]|uniref:class I adenylate-forming enzyme family protein n=1 Tax=Nocardia nova TaxID=37330 RepID=UPI00379F6746
MNEAAKKNPSNEPAAVEYFAWNLRGHDKRPCIGDDRIRLSYAEFAHVVDRCALMFRAVGLGAGDVVALHVPNRVELLVAMMAAWRLGAIVTPINPEFGLVEASHQLHDSKARVLITDTPEVAIGRNIAVIRIDEVLPAHTPTDGWSEELSSAPSPADIALLIYTSGTTGVPKGVALTHANLQFMASSMVTHLRLTADDHCLLVLPLFHVNAICVSFLSPILAGARLSITDRFSVPNFVRAVRELRPTYFSAVPMIYALLVRDSNIRPDAFASLRFAISGAAPISPTLLANAEELLGTPILEGYGLTEGTCASTCNPPAGPRKPGTVGPAMPGQTIAVDGPHGPTDDPSVIGEVLIRGENVMAHYHQRPAETAETVIDGWLHTGDIGVFDEDGYLSIVDRKKDMIIRGGENIYPKQIEDLLAQHPAVLEAAVVGRPDEVTGETPYAFVVARPNAKPTEPELRGFLAAQLIRAKVPTTIEFLETMPRNPIGKTDKIVLRERARERRHADDDTRREPAY